MGCRGYFWAIKAKRILIVEVPGSKFVRKPLGITWFTKPRDSGCAIHDSQVTYVIRDTKRFFYPKTSPHAVTTSEMDSIGHLISLVVRRANIAKHMALQIGVGKTGKAGKYLGELGGKGITFNLVTELLHYETAQMPNIRDDRPVFASFCVGPDTFGPMLDRSHPFGSRMHMVPAGILTSPQGLQFFLQDLPLLSVLTVLGFDSDLQTANYFKNGRVISGRGGANTFAWHALRFGGLVIYARLSARSDKRSGKLVSNIESEIFGSDTRVTLPPPHWIVTEHSAICIDHTRLSDPIYRAMIAGAACHDECLDAYLATVNTRLGTHITAAVNKGAEDHHAVRRFLRVFCS